jgi:hypothetical protein
MGNRRELLYLSPERLGTRKTLTEPLQMGARVPEK